MVELIYDFSNKTFWEGFDAIKINKPRYKYYVEDDSDDIKSLHKKYYNEALEKAAYDTMCEYADFLANIY